MDGENGVVVEYAYDESGNITSKVTRSWNNNFTSPVLGSVVSNITYSYTDAEWKDLLTSYNGQTLTYDNIGNPLNYRDGITLTWQNGRELASYADATQNITYTYDAGGLRTGKTVTKGTTTDTYQYVYEGGQLLQMKCNSIIIDFTYDALGDPVRLAYRSTPTSSPIYYYYALNSRGDVIGLYNSNGVLSVKYSYDAYGKLFGVTTASGSPITSSHTLAVLNPLRYRGYVYDNETGLYYLQSRYYDPVTCRFVNGDVPGILVASLSAHNDKNLFSYCDNNPVRRCDYDGYIWETVWDVISLGFGVYDVATNPDDATAWLGLAGDVVDLLPFACNIGDSIRGAKSASKIADAADDVHDTVKAVDNTASTAKTLHRPYIRKSTREAVIAAAPRMPDGRFIDPNTRLPINGKFDLGHVYGHEFWRERDRAMALGWSQKEFNDYMNNPAFYRIEDPISNRSHKYEMKR